ncbi:MAG: threonylcarbamoyl-AMP synthase [Oligoflexia bacterium]|nr:threonylcarbamoyl-AMP synthase [Oligoflexia bacterium]
MSRSRDRSADARGQGLVDRAVDVLRRGGLVAFPTETVYGLGADARAPLAVRRIFAAKGRPAGHPLIVHVPSCPDPADALAGWALPDPRADSLARAFWPGPLTLVLRRDDVPDDVTGGLPTVGLRVPDHPVAQALLHAFGGGIAAPSANRFGRISPTTAAHVREDLGEDLGEDLLVLDGGPCAIGVESTIIDLSGPTPALLRLGAVTRSRVEALIGPLDSSSATPAPGTLPGHYAPRTALRIAADPQAQAQRLRADGLTVAILPGSQDASTYARQLYAELRRLDQLGVDVLVAQPAQAQGLGLAVNDRLTRAARGSVE